MIPITSIGGATLDAVLLYTSILGILLLLATWVRLKIPLLKDWHIPASLLAGVIGLALGPHFIGLIPQEVTDFWSALSGRLIVIVFAPMLMGRRSSSLRKLARLAGPSISWSYGATFIQYGVPLLLCALLFTPLWGVPAVFGTIVEQGWAGGHGTAGGMAIVFEEIGWIDGASLSVTSATVGLIFGIVGGVALINVAVRKGWTRSGPGTVALKSEEAQELYPPEQRTVGSTNVISPNVVDSMAFHMALLSVAIFFGWILNVGIKELTGLSVSWFVTALFGGLLLQQVLNHTRWRDSVDKDTMSRLQGISLEFLVAGAVASVNIPVVVAYALPLIIQQACMMLIMLFLNVWLCRRIFAEDWFENSMVLFGTYTGVAATGLLLLRTVDPEMKSSAGEVFAARAPFCSWALGGGILTSMTPGLVMQYGAMRVGLVYTVGFLITFMIPRLVGWWYPPNKTGNKRLTIAK